MSDKIQYYHQVALNTLQDISSDVFQWTSFLKTASRFYKYNFLDQVMIYRQRPEATACAEYSVWRNIMHRYVKQGAKGIALVNDQGNFFSIRYVFDVADTGEFPDSRPVKLWKYASEYESFINSNLNRHYSLENEQDLKSSIGNIVENLAEKEWESAKGFIQEVLGVETSNIFNNTKESFVK